MKSKLTKWFNHFWYNIQYVPFVLKPFSWIYWVAQRLDQLCQSQQRSCMQTPPVIVVGNLTVGGTGKTPFIIALARQMQKAGYHIGIVTRAYGNQLQKYPHLVQPHDEPTQIGDEAALISQKVNAPLVISPNRQKAVEYIATHFCCDFILSDDGLQHYGMPRAMEIVMIDGQRGFGNQQLLPIGPLRQSLSRLKNVDFIVVNGEASPPTQKLLESMKLTASTMRLVPQPISPPLTRISEKIAAFAGIGNPQRFFQTLNELGIVHTPYPFADHHPFIQKDFEIPETCIIMTEKDAIKYKPCSTKSIHVLPVEACMQDFFWADFFSHPLFHSARR